MLTSRKGLAPVLGIVRECTLEAWAEVELIKGLFAEVAIRSVYYFSSWFTKSYLPSACLMLLLIERYLQGLLKLI